MRRFLKRLTGPSSPPDYLLLGSFVVLTVFGLIMLSSASSDLGKVKFGDTYYYLRHQIYFGLLTGAVLFYLLSLVSYRALEKISFFLMLGGILLLVLVFTPLGLTVGGATRWLHLGPVTIQPAEIAKLTYIVYLAAWLSNRTANRSKGLVEGLFPFLAISGVTGLLLAMQPATSTAAVILISGLVVYWVSGAPHRYVAGLLVGGFLTLSLLIVVTPYRLERVKSFFNHSADIQGARYHIEQALITIGSGGIWGVGYGQSTSKYNYLPEPIGDSIFAVIAEEFGFIGAGMLIAVFLLLVGRGFWLATKARDQFGRLLLVGFSSVIGLQAFIHIAAISGIIPLTGVPLPFISYGSTALASFLGMAGIAVNITKQLRHA